MAQFALASFYTITRFHAISRYRWRWQKRRPHSRYGSKTLHHHLSRQKAVALLPRATFRLVLKIVFGIVFSCLDSGKDENEGVKAWEPCINLWIVDISDAGVLKSKWIWVLSFKKLDNAIGNSLGISIPTVVKIVFRSVFGLPLKYKCSDEVTHTIRRRMDAPSFSACWVIIFSFKDAILISASISHIINLHDTLWENYNFKGCRL